MAPDTSGNTASDAIRGSTDADTNSSAAILADDADAPDCSLNRFSEPSTCSESLALQLRQCFSQDDLSEQFLVNAKQLLDEAVEKATAPLREENETMRAMLVDAVDVAQENTELRTENLNLWLDRILTEVSQGLPLKQKAVLAKLAEGIAIDEEDPLQSFEDQLKALKDAHCKPSYYYPPYELMALEEFHIQQEPTETPKPTDPAMAKIVAELEKLHPQR